MAKIIDFQNAAGHPIWLPGPNGEKIQFTKFERKPLDEWYLRYVPRYLRVSRQLPTPTVVQRPINSPVRQQSAHSRQVIVQPLQKQVHRSLNVPPQRLVGQVGLRAEQATHYLGQLIKRTNLSISNDIGIGILSFNRQGCLSRLVNSIRKFTDLARTTVFISDESTDARVGEYLKTIEDMAVLTNDRLGVAGNTNRLMRCLDRFKHKILLNDDVEILAAGWENFYFLAMQKTGLHHFCYRQPGVYGAKVAEGQNSEINGLRINTVSEKPHGAVMAYNELAFKTVGYFDEEFGTYGMEHVDWSNRVSISGIQQPGFHDVGGSDAYFRIYAEESAAPDRVAHFNTARARFEKVRNDRSRILLKPSARSEVPAITYIVPFRGADRHDCIRTVIQNIKAQRFPRIEIIAVEQDFITRTTLPEFSPIKYALAKSHSENQAFTKAMAFNLGASLSTTPKLILHDADMIVYDGYTAKMDQLLNMNEGVHVGQSVLYLSYESTNQVNATGKLTQGASVERSVKYYEGGSLGCHYNTYVKIGGFCEDFVGYGCEDCEFFNRLAATPKFFNERSIDLVHLWHGRTDGWKQHHERNKSIDANQRTQSMTERMTRLNAFLIERYSMQPR